MNILCLEKNNGNISYGEAFAAALFMLTNNDKISPKKWSIIIPDDVNKASYNKLLEYNIDAGKFITEFLDNNSLALLSGVLSKNHNNINNLPELIPNLNGIVSLCYIESDFPIEIEKDKALEYIKEISNILSSDIEKYYSDKVK